MSTLLDVGLGTAYERFAIYRLMEKWFGSRNIRTACEGPLDGMAGIPGLHLLGLARHGVKVTVFARSEEVAECVRAVYRLVAADQNLETRVLADQEIPHGKYDLLVSYNALPVASDWERHLEQLANVKAGLLMVALTNPASYGVQLRKVQRWARREAQRELFDHVATHEDVIEPALKRVGTILDHAYLDCPWWPDFLLPARQNLAGALLKKAKRLSNRNERSEEVQRFVFGPASYPFFEDQPGHAELRRTLRFHPVFDEKPAAVARLFGHLHAYLVQNHP